MQPETPARTPYRTPSRWARTAPATVSAGQPPAGGRVARPLLVLAGLVGLAALALVFAAYLSPHMVMDLANRLWSCF